MYLAKLQVELFDMQSYVGGGDNHSLLSVLNMCIRSLEKLRRKTEASMTLRKDR